MATLTNLSDVRALLQIQNTNEDGLLESLIEQAEGYAEGYCNTHLILSTRREVYAVRNSNAFTVQNRPIAAINSLKLNDTTIQPFSNQTKMGYLFQSSIVTLMGYKFSPGDVIQIDYNSGFNSTTVPQALKRAITSIAAQMYRNRDRIGLASEQMQSGGATTYVLTLDDQSKTTLDDFKRVTPHMAIGEF